MGFMRKKVSCHIITYNQESFIAQCIDGVLNQQTNFPIEIVIGDDNSTDRTREIVLDYARRYPDIIKLNLRGVRGSGIPGKENFMTTFEMCDGEYISLCDGDDYWTDPLKLQKQVDFLEANPDYVLTFHKADILTPEGNFMEDFITVVPDGYEDIETLARLGNYIHTPTVVFRNVIKELPLEFHDSPIGDYFLYMILAEHGKIKYFDNVMAVYRYGVGILSKMTSLDTVNTNVILYSCMISYLRNGDVKKILFQRQRDIIAAYDRQLRKELAQKPLSNRVAITYILSNFKEPSRLFSRINQRVFKFLKR